MNGQPSKRNLKTSFRPSPTSIRPLYTGGPVLLTKDGEWLITTMGEEVVVTEVRTGLGVARIKGDTTSITSLALSYHTSPPTIITCHQSNTIRYYPLPDSIISTSSKASLLTYTKALPKASTAPILVSAVSPDSTLLATGSSDGIVKVWDLEGGYVTHIFRGHGGPVSTLRFSFPSTNEDRQRMELWTGSTDAKVRVYDLRDATARVVGGGGASKPKRVLEGHVSVVRGIDVSEDGRWAITGGRDKVVLVWDLSETSKSNKGKTDAPKVVQTIMPNEQVEVCGLLPSGQRVRSSQGDRLLCYTAGDKGLVKVFDVFKGTEVLTMAGVEGVDEAEVDEDEQQGVVNVFSSLVSVHADQNIIYHSLSTGSTTRQIVGFNDDIIDSTFLSSSASSESHLALAANSNLIRIYSLSNFDARLLSGHKDMVLCLDKSADGRWLVSGSKDRTARIWAPIVDGSETTWQCVAICEGHAEAVGAVAMSRKMDDQGSTGRFLFTASQDRTIKMWDLTSISLDTLPDQPIKVRSIATLRVHEKDINSLDLAPNDRFLVSGSQDKLVKVFEVEFASSNGGASGAVRHIGTCKGHRRGVWAVKFSKVDRIIASGAADRTIKLWSLDDFSCLKTFEGHTNSVLRVEFLSQGMQLVSSASDGLVKLWNIRDEECIKTLDNHEDKIWALTVSGDEKTIVSAGADSVATFWEDSTEIEQAEKNEALVKAVQSEQDFNNYLSLKDYRRAIMLALAMSQPGRLLSLFTTVLASNAPGTLTGSVEVDEIIRTLPGLDLVRLLKHVRDWNANARTSNVAQAILYAILNLRTAEEIIQAFNAANQGPKLDNGEGDNYEENHMSKEDDEKKKSRKGKENVSITHVVGIKELLEGLIPYSERHFSRIDKLVQESYMLDYTISEMDGGLFGGEVMEVE